MLSISANPDWRASNEDISTISENLALIDQRYDQKIRYKETWARNSCLMVMVMMIMMIVMFIIVFLYLELGVAYVKSVFLGIYEKFTPIFSNNFFWSPYAISFKKK